jgi:O-antigen/teichoic acid export membrane protein
MGKAAQQGIMNSINSYIGVGLGALNTMILFPRIFSDNPEFMGSVNLLLAYSTLFAAFGHLGIPQSVIKYFPQFSEEDRGKFLSSGLWLAGLMSAGLLVFSLLAGANITHSWPFLAILGGSMLFYEIFASVSHIHKKTTYPIFLKNVGRRILLLSVLLAEFFFDLTEVEFLWLLAIGYILHALLMMIYAAKDLPPLRFSFDVSKYSVQWIYGVFIVLSVSLDVLVSRLDIIMIGEYLDNAQVSFYSIAFFVGSVVSIPSKSLVTSLRPYISESWAQGNTERLKRLYTRGAEVQLLVNTMVFFLIAINAQAINQFLPDTYEIDPMVIFAIGLGQIVLGGTGPSAMILLISKSYRLNFVLGLVMVGLSIGLNAWLIPQMGIRGAAVATLFSVIIYEILKLIVLQHQYKMNPLSRNYLWALLGVGLYVVAAYYLPQVDYSLYDFPVISNLVGISVLLMGGYFIKTKLASFE